MNPNQKILIAGGYGMVGSALVRLLRHKGFDNLLIPSRKELDLRQQKEVQDYLLDSKPDVVVIAAAKVGGIFANMTYPAEFIYDNLMLSINLIHGSHLANVPRLLFLGSSCVYPKFAPQPIPEEALLTAALEPTNEAYAIAKIAAIKLCTFYSKQYGRKYSSVMPTNLYGPGDNYHSENSHVIPALLRKFHEAKIEDRPEVSIWGTGKALREFLHVDDLATALYILLDSPNIPDLINVGSSEEMTISELAHLVAEATGYTGRIVFDPSKPEGTPRKKVDCSKIFAKGWKPLITLPEGLRGCYEELGSCSYRSV